MKNHLITLIILITFTSCQVDEEEFTVDLIQNQPMLNFQSEQELANYLNQVELLSSEELTLFEKKNSFTSLKRKSDEVMDNLARKEFTSYADFDNFLNENCDFIKIVEENGEKSIIKIHEETSNQLIANLNGVFQLKNKGYKVFNEGLVSLPISRLEDFQQTNTFDEAILSGFDIVYRNKVHSKSTFVENTIQANSSQTNCPNREESETTSTGKKNRTIVEIKTMTLPYFSLSNIAGQKTVVKTKVRAQKKVFNTWTPAYKYISGFFKYTAWYSVNLGSKTRVTNEIHRLISKKDFKWENEYTLFSTTSLNKFLASGFDNFWGWGDSDYTTTAYVACNMLEICQGGLCPGPNADPCPWITCPLGYTCDNGNCIPPSCNDFPCPIGYTCTNGNCIDQCSGVLCSQGYICQNGQCVPDTNPQCDLQNPCPQGEQCLNGVCAPL